MKTVQIIINIQMDTESDKDAIEEVNKWIDDNEFYDYDTRYYPNMNDMRVSSPVVID